MAWEAKGPVLPLSGVCALAKIRGWSAGGAFMCVLGVKWRSVGESLHPGGEGVWPCGESVWACGGDEKIAEVLCEVLRSWFALRVLTQIVLPSHFSWAHSFSFRDGV